MEQVSASDLAELKRAELEVVLEALSRTPRLAGLLRFLGDKYFQGKLGEITEYNIATEVFGRSKTSFDGSSDSIARVEAHRLRKRLKEYYESEGKDHSILISLPYRSYVPEFTQRSVSLSIQRTDTREGEKSPSGLLLAQEGISHAIESDSGKPARAGREDPRKRTAVYAVSAIAILVVASLAATVLWKRGALFSSLGTSGAHPQNQSLSPTPADAAHVPLRLLAGYTGTPRIDSAGAYWQPDRYFSGGSAFERPGTSVSRTSDPMLFEHWRTGDFSYDIPLAPGSYELHLFFIASPPENFKTQFFNVSANGQDLLTAFSISADALGLNIADEKVFKDISPAADGRLHLKFFVDRSPPVLNALEILPGTPHRQLPVRIVMQPAAITDHDGNLWHPDTYFENGTLSDPPRKVTGSPDPDLYAIERYGHFTYSIPLDTRGRYTVILHFAELYWMPDPGFVRVGSRVFRVYCNGSMLLDNFDIFKEAGSLHALTKTFHHLRPSPEGKLDLTFDPIVNYATVSAIEVIDESE
jgi:Malectin domain